jgi:membrane protein
MRTTVKTFYGLLQQAAGDWMSDNAPRLGAALAYYTVFSISPLMIIVVAIAGLWFGHEAARQQIFDQLSGLIGHQGAEAVQRVLANAHRPETGVFATLVAVITLLIGSTGVFVELQDALNTIWGVKAKSSKGWVSFVWNRVISFAMVLAIGFLLLVSLLLSAALAALGKYLGHFAPDIQLAWQVMNFLLSFGVITLLFALMFKFLPDVRIAWKDVWIGALITSFLFTLGKFLLGLYLGRTGVASTYGAAGSLVVVLVWVYYSAQILFFGAEFTQVHANRAGKHLKPVEYAEPIKVEEALPAALKRRGEVHFEDSKLEASVSAAVTEANPHREHRDWKFTLPLALLLTLVWFKERKRPSCDGKR